MDQAANKQDNSSCPSSARTHPRVPLTNDNTEFFLDRLPTLSAADALQAFHSASKQSISTGLKSLDALLQGREPGEVAQDEKAGGGLRRGQVTEVWGPAGVGKTAFACVKNYLYRSTVYFLMSQQNINLSDTDTQAFSMHN